MTEEKSLEFFRSVGLDTEDTELNRKKDEIVTCVWIGDTIVFRIDDHHYKGRVMSRSRLNMYFDIDLTVAPIEEEDRLDKSFDKFLRIGAKDHVGVLE